MSPIFLTLDEVIEIHRDQISRYGGSHGVRDLGLLQSALAMPASGFGQSYFHEDIPSMAAAYLFHVAQNHPFVDGNKRTATVAALVFLALNGVEITIGELALERVVRKFASSKMSKEELVIILRKHIE